MNLNEKLKVLWEEGKKEKEIKEKAQLEAAQNLIQKRTAHQIDFITKALETAAKRNSSGLKFTLFNAKMITSNGWENPDYAIWCEVGKNLVTYFEDEGIHVELTFYNKAFPEGIKGFVELKIKLEY